MKLDVLLVTRACIDSYPPTRNQANILAERGLRVGVIDLNDPLRAGTELHETIYRRQPHRQWNSKTERPPSLPIRVLRRLQFARATAETIREHRPAVVIGYDFIGAEHLPFSDPDIVKLCHFHELFIDETDMTRGSRRAMRKVCRHWPGIRQISFPDDHRARAFMETLHPACPTVTVMNCPRLMKDIPVPLRPEDLRNRVGNGYAVVFLGSVGQDQGVIETVRSMSFWPEKAHFVIIGPASEVMRDTLMNAAPDAAARKRVHLLGARPHREALGLASLADVAVAMVQPNNRNWELSAGAINKRFEYAALGLAQVTSDLPGVRSIFGDPQTALLVPPSDCDAIGKAIRKLLDDKELRGTLAINGRKKHLADLNYEAQFGPLAERIEEKAETLKR